MEELEIKEFTPAVATLCKYAAQIYRRRTGCNLWTLDDLEQQAYVIALELLQGGARYWTGAFFNLLQYRLIDYYRAETKTRRRGKMSAPTFILFPWDSFENRETTTQGGKEIYFKDARGELIEYDKKTFARVCRRVIARCDKTTRAIFRMRYLGGKTFRDIAGVIGLSETTTSEKARKACGKIKRAYFREMWNKTNVSTLSRHDARRADT